MGDCYPKSTSAAYDIRFPLPAACLLKTGNTEYKSEFKQWPDPVVSLSMVPNGGSAMASYLSDACGGYDNMGLNNKPRYSFSKGARFGVPPYCDCTNWNQFGADCICTPPPERSRFTTTYQNDYFDKLHQIQGCKNIGNAAALPGIKERCPLILPPQCLCPFSNETTYARAFDMTQPFYNTVCNQQDSCGGGSSYQGCEQDNGGGSDPVSGITIRYANSEPRLQVPILYKNNLIQPGTDTVDCPRCPRKLSCCPCPDGSRLCDACCGCDYPCKLHQAATTPTRQYPIILNTPRYVPDPRVPPRRPKLLCSGGTGDCPLQNSFPTSAAINAAQQRLIEKLEEERCRFPPECIESSYRASFKTPPLQDVPKYCSKENQAEVHRANQLVSCKGLPPMGMPMYCLDGGRPPDPRPMFDHLSTYEADYLWNVRPRFKLLGGEIGCQFTQKPLCYPCASDLIKCRTEEKERWGGDWECNPEPA